MNNSWVKTGALILLASSLLATPATALAQTRSSIERVFCVSKAKACERAAVHRDKGVSEQELVNRIREATDAGRIGKLAEFQYMIAVETAYSKKFKDSPQEIYNHFFKKCLNHTKTPSKQKDEGK